MGQIVILNQNMINMIAAGEVIERPASVVKELMENAVDAGACQITVRIEEGGRKLISVTDNGCGMDAEDLALAFEPHATSKLKTSADLLNISTMGFRGEALASIGSVANISVVSKKADAVEANKIEVDCGRTGQVQPTSGTTGTTVEVRNIFYKLPGRRKFLRTANTEMTHIVEQFIRVGLSGGKIGMTLIHNGRKIYQLSENAGTKERIEAFFSREIAEGLIELRSSERNLSINGYIARPEKARANSKYQYIFLNGRFIKDKFIAHAIKEAHRGMIEPNRFAVVFLFLQMPAQNFDVNVHPTKIEVRFDNSNLVHSQVLGVIREKLLSLNLDVHGKLPESEMPQAQGETISRNVKVADAMAEFFREHKPINTVQQKFGFSNIRQRSDETAVRQREGFYQAEQFAGTAGENFIQIHNSYILTQTDDGFMIIDQHALHERIIYEQLCRRLAEKEETALEKQKLLIPETFDVNSEQMELLKTNRNLLDKLAIEVEPFGPRTVAVQSFPSILNKVKPAEFVLDILDLLAESSEKIDAERLLHKTLEMTACKAAVKAGQKLSNTEIQQLLSDKETVERAGRCPHGRPTTIKLTIAQLEKQFGRT